MTDANLDRQRMMDTAVSFFLAGERSSVPMSFGPYPSHTLGAPEVTSYALSLEVFLKLLSDILNIPARGHEVSKIFQNLPSDIRADVECRYARSGDIVAKLREYDSCFVKWRYPYETDILETEISDLRRLCIVCHSVIKQMAPKLQSCFEKAWEREPMSEIQLGCV